jgi:hypothetical protein
MKTKTLSSMSALLVSLFVLAGCQSSPSKNNTAATDTMTTTEPAKQSTDDSQITLPEKMHGSWRDGGQNGPISARRVKETGPNTYAGEMTFNGVYEGCQRFEPFTAVLAPGGNMTLTHPCIDTANLTYDPNKGWSGRVGWGDIKNLR